MPLLHPPSISQLTPTLCTVRNAYTLIDFGNFVSNSDDDSDPFVQLLPLTTPAEAHSDFVQKRLGGVDTTIALLPASEGQASPESKAEKEQHLKGEVLRNWPYIFVGCLALVGIFVGLIVWKFCCKRRRQAAKAAKAAKGDGPKSQNQQRETFQMASRSERL